MTPALRVRRPVSQRTPAQQAAVTAVLCALAEGEREARQDGREPADLTALGTRLAEISADAAMASVHGERRAG